MSHLAACRGRLQCSKTTPGGACRTASASSCAPGCAWAERPPDLTLSPGQVWHPARAHHAAWQLCMHLRQLWLSDADQQLGRQQEVQLSTAGVSWISPSWVLSGGRQAALQWCLQDEAVRGQHHVEGLQLRVCEQKQLLAQYRKEGRRMKKTLATYEVGPAARMASTGVALLHWLGQCYIQSPPWL